MTSREEYNLHSFMDLSCSVADLCMGVAFFGGKNTRVSEDETRIVAVLNPSKDVSFPYEKGFSAVESRGLVYERSSGTKINYILIPFPTNFPAIIPERNELNRVYGLENVDSFSSVPKRNKSHQRVNFVRRFGQK